MNRAEWLSSEALSRGWTDGAEIGVKEGATLFYLLETVPDLNMTGVDIWKPTQGYTNWNHDRHFKAVRDRAMAFGSRATIIRETSVAAAEIVPDAVFDFVFIDADHSFEAVCADIDAWRPKVRDGGMLCGHDANHDGVRRALDARLPGWRLAGHDRCWIFG